MKTLILIFSLIMSTVALAKDITYKIGGQEYEGYFLKKSSSAPTVFILHDWDGLTDYEKKRAKMFLDMGFSVFAADLFGKGVRPTEVKDKRQHTGELYKNRKKMRSLMIGALKTAKAQGLNTSNSMAIGYCFGGAAALEWARSGERLKGFASFHGGLKTPKGQSYKGTKGKVLVFHGTADKMIKMAEFATLADELELNKIKHEMITYSGAPHAFTVFGSERYRKEADEQSWSRLSSYLKSELL